MEYLWYIVYLLGIFIAVWLLIRFIVWHIASFVKRKFHVDITFKSVRFLSVHEITIRVNQLQTIEIDKISLQLKFRKNDVSHRVYLHVGEVRVRAEMKQSNELSSNNSPRKTHKRTLSWDKKRVFVERFVQRFFKYAFVRVDVLNFMFLNALVPNSLVHVNICGIHLGSPAGKFSQCDSDLIGSLSVETANGKVLKSPTEVAEVTSCIAEFSTSLEVIITASKVNSQFLVTSISSNLSSLNLELHEGALIPGILIPKLNVSGITLQRTKTIDKIKTLINKVIRHLPETTNVSVSAFGLAFFGDETMGQTTRGAHVCCRSVKFKQVKDSLNTVDVLLESSESTVPSGYTRIQVDDVTMTDYYKHKVANMGKTVVELKLTSNGVLSLSCDLISWHADYIHNESVQFWSIIFNKLKDAARLNSSMRATSPQNKQDNNKNTQLFGDTKKVETSQIHPDFNINHPDLLKGTEHAMFNSNPDHTNTQFGGERLFDLFCKTGISLVLELTVYDASMDAIFTPIIKSDAPCPNPPSLTISLDSFTGSIDQSPHSRDFNYMAKLDKLSCLVAQECSPINIQVFPKSFISCRPNCHQWGQALNLENLGLHGSASFETLPKPTNQQQKVTLLIDAKLSGVQVEISKCTGLAIASFLHVIHTVKNGSQMCTSVGEEINRQVQNVVKKSKYKYRLSCVEVEVSKINAFILSSDETKNADCLVSRIDNIKAELNNGSSTSDGETGKSYNLSLVGVAVTTVHNPYFSAFASYEANVMGGRVQTTNVPASMREKQIEESQYRCVESASISPNYLCFDVLEVSYAKKYLMFDPDESQSGSVKHEINISLTQESEVKLHWSPALHALVHYEVKDFIDIISPFTANKRKSVPVPLTNLPSMESSFSNHGDHACLSKPIFKASGDMYGDGARKLPDRVIELSVNVSSSALLFCLNGNHTLQLLVSPIRCDQSVTTTHIHMDEFKIVMDAHNIFTFTNNDVELSVSNQQCQNDRKKFSDLATACNRAWAFKFQSIKCHFPYKFGFAKVFDQAINSWKWVKGLYRKTSHPFRSTKLPPDLQFSISQFTFELADWPFESRLRDNHDLMQDEWVESEKRRRVLDSKISELRRQRGEMLPAKKVGELYRQLATTNIHIYLVRSQKMYAKPTKSVLLTWTVSSFELTVLADESMHGTVNAMNTIRTIDHVSPFPFNNTREDEEPEFVTLWCRNISMKAGKHQVRIRNYPQCLMDFTEWKISGKFCGAEQKGVPTALRTEYVYLPAPWGRVKVLRNMPPLKFYHDFSSEVQDFKMAWGPCWDSGWSQVNLALNYLNKDSVDPSHPIPWWDKSRILFHGRLSMSMERVSMLHLASLDPYNTTEHMSWDWKNLYMDWIPGSFMYKGDLDIHIRNASKYDDVCFLHLPNLKMEWIFDWVCLNNANPQDHHSVMPCAPDKIEDGEEHDTYKYFRSRNIDVSISFDVTTKRPDSPNKKHSDYDTPKVLLYSTTLRWLNNFGVAVNAVARPICKGPLFDNCVPPKLKLSRHYRNVKTSFHFPNLEVSYWSSYAQQIGIEYVCGKGDVAAHFRLSIIPYEGNLIRRSMGEWSVISTTCQLKDTKIFLLNSRESSDLSPHQSFAVNRNFLLSLSRMVYCRDYVAVTPAKSEMPGSSKKISFSQSTNSSDASYKSRNKKVNSPKKKPQTRHTLVVHDLRGMWTTENRDIGYGLYEGYNKAAVLRRNLSTKVLKNFHLSSSEENKRSDGQKSELSTPTTSLGPKTMDARNMLNKLLSETEKRFVVQNEAPTSEQQQLSGVSACKTNDVTNQNWQIKFVNCQAMLKGPKTQGYIIMTASQADFVNRDHKVMWRDGQLTTKLSWQGSLSGTQVFASVDRNATSSEHDGADVPWLSVSDIAPRGPSPGMLDISDLMGGGQAIGGVVGDGVSAGAFQLQRIVSRCTCHMFYVGYEALVDSEQTDYGEYAEEERHSADLLSKERPVNILTVLQPDLEICTNANQFTMIIDIVENLLLYVEPIMREHWERVDRMRFTLRLTSADNVAMHRGTLADLQNRVRTRLTNMRRLERLLYRTNRALDQDPGDYDLIEKSTDLRNTLAAEKETLNEESEELGIIIRCFKEMVLRQKTKHPSLKPDFTQDDGDRVVRATEVSFGQVKWHLTDADGQLNIAQFEMKDFLYEKLNKSDDRVSHCFEAGWLCLLNLLPNSLYRDVLKPHHQIGVLKHHGVSGEGGRSLTLRVICNVRPPVGGISVKDHVEVNAVPLTIQLTYQFFKRLMTFFFPDKGLGGMSDDLDLSDLKDGSNAALLGLTTSMGNLSSRPPPPSPSISSVGSHKRNRSFAKKEKAAAEVTDDVDKMKARAAKNNTFLYIKVTQVPLCVSYKGEKEKNIEDVHNFNLTIPMLEYHSMTWTWHDLAMAVKRDCKKQLVSQVIKEKLHLGAKSYLSSSSSTNTEVQPTVVESDKAKLLFGSSLRKADGHKKSLFRKKK